MGIYLWSPQLPKLDFGWLQSEIFNAQPSIDSSNIFGD